MDADCIEMKTLFPSDEPLLNIQQVHDGEYHAAGSSPATAEKMVTLLNCDAEPIRLPGSSSTASCCSSMARENI